ncbi:hypothetical protein QJS10_CPB22g00252 [Acorus calamus]|uniref:Uncharacterized protein n=1 Tax=Acorus calamus TaxID=4465 RepID=A0AAV9C182_ACOCL|nr:hypothetical protein QJS10_CPB22g00252 [Acorus calamus]
MSVTTLIDNHHLHPWSIDMSDVSQSSSSVNQALKTPNCRCGAPTMVFTSSRENSKEESSIGVDSGKKMGSSILVQGNRLVGPQGIRRPSGILTTLLNECLCLHIVKRRKGLKIHSWDLRFRRGPKAIHSSHPSGPRRANQARQRAFQTPKAITPHTTNYRGSSNPYTVVLS